MGWTTIGNDKFNSFVFKFDNNEIHFNNTELLYDVYVGHDIGGSYRNLKLKLKTNNSKDSHILYNLCQSIGNEKIIGKVIIFDDDRILECNGVLVQMIDQMTNCLKVNFLVDDTKKKDMPLHLIRKYKLKRLLENV